MVTQTKTILQQIQDDVEVYMEKLSEIEKQFIQPIIEEKEIEKPSEEKPNLIESINEIEINPVGIEGTNKIEEKEEKPIKFDNITEIEEKIDQILLKSKNK
jgi:hypothetical protein